MARSDDTLERAKPEENGLESYRRLIELQKQMIELSQHHEQSKRECDALRLAIAREVAARHSAVVRFRNSAGKLFKSSPFELARQLFS